MGAGGSFHVLAITAGVGNGWVFDAETLKKSLPLWEGVECFVDHGAAPGQARSLRDLGGRLSQAQWDEAHLGIRAVLQTLGPAGELVRSLGQQMVQTPPGSSPRVGFSADVAFQARGKEVREVVKVYSVDLVFNPARGGRFLSAAGGEQLAEGAENAAPASRDQLCDQGAGMEEQKVQPTLAGEAEKARQVRVELCSHLLEASLAASKLPTPLQEGIRRQFAGQAFEPEALKGAIEEGRGLVSALTGASSVQGPRITGMADSRDQLQAAVDDLLGAEREKGMENASVARLSGIRELYLTLTGDYDLHGGYFPERARLATSADFTGLVKNALNKVVAERWAELGRAGYDWWRRVAVCEHFESLHDITGTLVGTVGSLPVVAEGGTYAELSIGDSAETASFVKYGGYIPLTLELIDRDETRKLRAYPRELAAAGMRKISSLVAGIFTEGSGAGPEMADGEALFNGTAVSSAGGHANLGSTALSADSWEAACTAVYNQPMLVKNSAGKYGTGPKMGINPRYLLVPRALQLTGMKILYPSLENAANIYSENQQRGQPGDVVTVPDWSDGSDWAAVCDPRVAPAIFVGERFGLMPEVFIAGDELSPAVFSNDEHRLKVRHFLAVWVNDFRPLYKANVTG